MRDVAHQAMRAHLLGRRRHNRNMLRRFAENTSDYALYRKLSGRVMLTDHALYAVIARVTADRLVDSD